MKRIIIIIVLAFIGTVSIAQTQVKVGENGKLVKVEKPKVEIPTGYTFEIKGKDYPVYKTDKGKYFVTLYSEEKQKNYRRYLKLVQ